MNIAPLRRPSAVSARSGACLAAGWAIAVAALASGALPAATRADPLYRMPMGAPPLTIETAEASFLAAPGPVIRVAMLPEAGSTGPTVAPTAQRRVQLPPAMPTNFIAIPVATPEFTVLRAKRSKRGRVYAPPGMQVIPPLEKPISPSGRLPAMQQPMPLHFDLFGSEDPAPANAPASSGTEPQDSDRVVPSNG